MIQPRVIQQPTYVTSTEAGEILAVSPKTISRWAKEGRLAHQKTLGGHRRYPRADLQRLARELQQPVIHG